MGGVRVSSPNSMAPMPRANGKVADPSWAEAAPAPLARTSGWAKVRLRFESSVGDEMATMVDSKGRLWRATRLH